jgi:hypothetical protein
MQDSKHLWLAFGLALALALGCGSAAWAQASFSVSPAQPTPGDRPLFTLLYTPPASQCAPTASPFPTISGDRITFHATPSTTNCSGTVLYDWQIGPLLAGFWVARVEIAGVEIASLPFEVGIGNLPLPPLVLDPPQPTVQDPVFLLVSGVATSSCSPLFQAPVLRGTEIVLFGEDPLFPVTPDCQGPWTRTFSVPPLPPGTYTASVILDAEPYTAATFTVVASQVRSAALAVTPLLPSTADPLSLTAEVDPGCPVTFGPPVVAPGRVTMPADLDELGDCSHPASPRIAQLQAGPLAPGAYVLELDVNGQSVATQGITVTAPATTLPLFGGRFAATLTWLASPSFGGAGVAVPLTDQSGYFWFFDDSDLEVTLKILDGRPVNGHFWLFAASMTNLPFTLKVQDLGSPRCGAGGVGCPVRTYMARQGMNENFIDLGSL